MISTLLDYVSRRAWALDEPVLHRMVEIFNRHASGVRLSREEIAQAIGKRSMEDDRMDDGPEPGETPEAPEFDPTKPLVIGDTALIEVSGVVAKYARQVNDVSQPRGVSLEILGQQLANALADRNVERIFLAIESPGGCVDGLADFADQVYQASLLKPVVAFADDMAASAAYWIGSQACQFLASQTAAVGSVGVYGLMVDSSAAYQDEGYKVHIIRSGPNKGVGAPGVEITDENLSVEQTLVDGLYQVFVQAVLRGRSDAGMDAKAFSQVADGRCLLASEALALKMIDGIDTIAHAWATCYPKPRGSADAAPPLRRVSPGAGEDGEPNMENPDMFSFLKRKPAPDQTPEPASATEPTPTPAAEGSPAPAADAAAAEKAVEADRARATAIAALCQPLVDAQVPGMSDLVSMATSQGLSLEATKAAGFDVLAASLFTMAAEAEKTVSDLQARLNVLSQGVPLEKIPATGASDADAGEGLSADDGKPETYTAAVASGMKAGKSRATAIVEAARTLPASHAAWVASGSELPQPEKK